MASDQEVCGCRTTDSHITYPAEPQVSGDLTGSGRIGEGPRGFRALARHGTVLAVTNVNPRASPTRPGTVVRSRRPVDTAPLSDPDVPLANVTPLITCR
jgi:hypothetical protein